VIHHPLARGRLTAGPTPLINGAGYLARHECGTKICREKGIEYARRRLEHTNISTTQQSMYLDDSELADAQDLID
jgi:hypothetical protein